MSVKINVEKYPVELREGLSKLSEKEISYFKIMWSKYGVLFLKSRPGEAKSSITKSIANKLGMRYFDIRLTLIDETDIGLFPIITDVNDSETGNSIKTLDYAVPRWALEANKQPSIIHFEELNRASKSVRDAAMQILLDRQIGVDFKFNDNVLMVSSGNLGDDDNTDVDEMDSALRNRMITIEHNMSLDFWMENFANENVHYLITSFLRENAEYFFTKSDESNSFATARSWTMLSEYMKNNFDESYSNKDMVEEMRFTNIGIGTIGNVSETFYRYIMDSDRINYQDILYRFDNDLKNKIKKSSRDKKSELIYSLKNLKTEELFNEKTYENLIEFFKIVSSDERMSFFHHLTRNAYIIKDLNTNPYIKKVFNVFNDEFRWIKSEEAKNSFATSNS